METFMRLPIIATLSCLSVMLALPSASQASPDPPRDLSGLLTGDSKIDRALEQAYMRGYQRGKADEAKSKTR
jgi:hypothetical protein